MFPLMLSTEPTNASSSLISNTGYAKTTRELIQFVSTLRALGGQAYLDLPRIVVIGNQSAGKSSLVEAISGINVPRDAGTCTRCPMECRLANFSEPWSCQVYIRWEFDDDGQRLEEVSEVPFGPRLTDKAEIESILRRAQAAILNPAIPLSHFLDADLETIKAGGVKVLGARPLPFSRNVICVDLAGPDLIDLSFVDLPGIVQNAEPEVVHLVEDLVTSHVESNCLILVTLPMSDDIENQKAARIAKQADPDGLRTIGVLTKPDTLPAGATKSREMWLEVLEGRRHKLKHGYFCTRQPDDDKRLLGISPADARADEVEFFKTTAPWSTSVAHTRFGTANLVKNISELLTGIITDSLPNLIGEVTSQLAACKKQLDTLPPATTTDPTAFVFNLVVTFCSEVARHVEGSPTHTRFVQDNKSTFAKFKHAILSTAPLFIPFEADKAPDDLDTAKYTNLAGEASDDIGIQNPASPKALYLGDVRHRVQSSVTRELPNNVPYSAKRSFIFEFQESWEHQATKCFESVHKAFKNTLTELIKQMFERFANLRAVIAPVVMEQLQTHTNQAIAHVQTILLLEKASPFTQNTHYLSEKRAAHLAQYKRARSGVQKSIPRDRGEIVSDALSMLTKLGYAVKEEDLSKLNPPDEYEEELELMAEVRAYFQVAYKRIIDYIPLSIDQHFLYAFSQALQAVLFDKLGLGSPNSETRCAAYIAEEPGVVALRSELLSKKKQLESLQAALYNFGL
ncbi:P-loop containing nucleoside triphosphate hydrolase protein [Ganoderma leucocontextum]|nr:P-loop containing nucleoside triphosphate hydrolase protein [Ganoderma leucocontextum]